MEKWFEDALSNLSQLDSIKWDLVSEIKKKQTLLQLVNDEQIRNVNSMISRSNEVQHFCYYAEACFNNASKFKDFENFLNEIFEDKPIYVDRVVQRGMSSYGWEIHLRVPVNGKNILFNLEVPIPNSLTIDNFDEANRGKFALYADDGNSNYDVIAVSYDFEDVKKAYKIFLKEGFVK